MATSLWAFINLYLAQHVFTAKVRDWLWYPGVLLFGLASCVAFDLWVLTAHLEAIETWLEKWL